MTEPKAPRKRAPRKEAPRVEAATPQDTTEVKAESRRQRITDQPNLGKLGPDNAARARKSVPYKTN